MLPETYILRDSVTIIANNDQYQYRVTYSIFGEILKIELPFLKLPANARQLIKGKDTENYLLGLENYKKLLRFQIPLAILGFWRTDEFLQISSSIKERESELGEGLPDNFLPFITDPWLKEFYLKIKEDIAQKGTGDFWRGLAGLMTHDPVVMEASFRYLRAYSWELPAAIIGNLWPLVNSRVVLRHFYEHAHLYPSQSNRDWLLKSLPSEESTFFRGLMLKGLSVYQDESVYQALMRHYETQKEMGEGEAEILLSALSTYNTPEVQLIAWSALVGKNYFAAKAAHDVLNKQGVDEKKIAEKLTLSILNDQYSDRVNSLLSRFQDLENKDLLLSSEQFLARSVYAVKKHKDIRPQTNLANLLDRTWQPGTLSIIIEFLYHPEPMVRRLGLDQIGSLFVQFPNRLNTLKPDTLRRIFQLTSDATEAVRIEALETIRVLVPRLGQPSWIINLLNIQNRQQLLSALLPAILALHRKHFTELAVVPFCLKNLTHKVVNIRRYSILILQYYRLPEVVAALKKQQSDSEPIIQEALGRGWREDDDLVKVLR